MEHNMNSLDGNAAEKLNHKLENISAGQKEEILANFEKFKEYLGSKVSMGKSMGLSEEQLANAAQKVGDYLAAKVEPQNREEKLLQELWKAGSEEERHMLSHMLIKLID
ncbi:DUF3243 domain-containing protein [Bacillus sp. T33-2]|uniref:DUF3243 domain-containing protein n=1 Tax=Bacillus sp. T33-2 TaxID=2054168 RepID=UPI000C774D9A|nr:DUF3243 domain-containing protein [Bacillus sp. T33-2]PLR95261.1 DUF3243 domain-containing protein [Bacillus sp. T33-2]